MVGLSFCNTGLDSVAATSYGVPQIVPRSVRRHGLPLSGPGAYLACWCSGVLFWPAHLSDDLLQRMYTCLHIFTLLSLTSATCTQTRLARHGSTTLRSGFLGGTSLQSCRPATAAYRLRGHWLQAAAEQGERFRLDNLAPQPGSKHRKKRVGRGHAAGQVCRSAL